MSNKIQESIHETLRATWNREISADDAAEEIQSLFLSVGELTADDQSCFYVSLEDELIEMFEDGAPVFMMLND